MDIAMQLLKAPVVDTDVPGVRMAHGTDVTEPVIGNMPYMWGSNDQLTQMTPNEYFDAINQDEETSVPGRDADYRWDGRQFNQHGNSRENIARIIEGIKQGMPIGMPELDFRNDAYSGVQEGGHRMEALRQMGHADTQVPVFRHNRIVQTGEPMDIAYQLLKWESQTDMHAPERNFNQYFGIKDSWITLPKEGMDSRPELYGEVASAMNTAYAGVGGHDKYKDGGDLQGEDKHARYDMIDNDEDPYVDAARVFSQQDQGFKVSLTAHDGRKDARVAVKEHMFDHMKTPGHYAELSGGWNRLMEEQGIDPIEDYTHIQDLVNRPTRPTETGRGTYTRDIGGTEREKQIYGQPMKEGAEWMNDFMQQSVAASRAGEPLRLDDYNYPTTNL